MLYPEISSPFYRVSMKGIIRNEEGKVLLCKESDGRWDLPGGGLDWDEKPKEGLKREMMEEMGLIVTSIDKTPIAFATVKRPPHGKRKHDVYIANVCYQLSVESLDFVPSDECVEIGFFDLDDLSGMSLFENVKPVFEQLFSS